MAEMKVEHTADGREIVYRVYVHPEVFNWHEVKDLIDILTKQFREHVADTLYTIRDEVT